MEIEPEHPKPDFKGVFATKESKSKHKQNKSKSKIKSRVTSTTEGEAENENEKNSFVDEGSYNSDNS
jgi:hypothetical protein